MTSVKVVEYLGCSKKDFEDAVKEAIKDAGKKKRHIVGARVIGQNVVVKDNKISEYRANVKIAYVME